MYAIRSYYVAVARQDLPFEAAFVPAGVDHLGDLRQADHRLYARGILHAPGEPVHRIDDRIIDTPVRRAFGDHGQQVDADREMIGDNRRIPVVAGVGTQFRYAAMQIADLHLCAAHRPVAEQSAGKQDHHQRRPRPGQAA